MKLGTGSRVHEASKFKRFGCSNLAGIEFAVSFMRSFKRRIIKEKNDKERIKTSPF